MQDFNSKCFNFQQQFVDFFNKEEGIPFLLKYYLIEQIWLNIVRTKDRIYQQSKNEKTVQQTFDIPILKKQEEQTTKQ